MQFLYPAGSRGSLQQQLRARTKGDGCVSWRGAVSVKAAASTWDGPPVVIAGAGIAGLASAVALNKVGIPVKVLEASSDGLREEGAAIGVWQNAWRCLDELGVADQLRPTYAQLDKVELLRENGRLLRRFGFEECDAGRDGATCEFRGVRRGHLLRVLADSLPPGTITFGERVSRLVHQGGSAGSPWPVAQLENGSTIEAGVLVAADGARSTLAREGLGLPSPGYAGYTAYRGVACPEGGTASLGIPLDTIRFVWGTGVRAGQYALNDKEVYWFTVFNAPADEAVPPNAEARMADAIKYVKGWAWSLEETIRSTPASSLSRSRITDRWTLGAFGKGLVTLAGDAAHPMTPNLGQGGCVSLEDGVILGRTLSAASQSMSSSGTDAASSLEAALRQYEQARSKRCFPLTARSNVMGALLQLPFEPVSMVRDAFVSTAFSPTHFLDHTSFDCGPLPE